MKRPHAADLTQAFTRIQAEVKITLAKSLSPRNNFMRENVLYPWTSKGCESVSDVLPVVLKDLDDLIELRKIIVV